ncbi:MAG: CPBP family intramembrane metalloprotease [Candidatus Eremiobacteraeota bacterium]|nr:CPBP family intramembrane metalloprotease [Candidatus Eremiobacteraeota bacterium]MBV8366000.1 CPBP family intramembrane metalloprotease [Candidatus Eremiobacteraeota bacterium]
MELVTPQPTTTIAAGSGPAFHKRWNGWTILWIFVVLAFLYIGVQTGATIALLFLKFPDIMSAAMHGDNSALMALVTTPAGLARILTPLGFLFIMVPTTVVMVAATLVLARGALRASLEDLGFGKPLTGYTALIAVGAGLGLFLLSGILSATQEHFFGAHPQQIALILKQHRGVASLVLDLLSAAFLAPLWEETFFRGVFFASLVQRMPFWPAAILSGLAFGLAHGDLWNLVPLAVLGVGLAYVYYRTGNIWANIVTHATINGSDLVIQFLFPQLTN